MELPTTDSEDHYADLMGDGLGDDNEVQDERLGDEIGPGLERTRAQSRVHCQTGFLPSSSRG